MSRIIINFRCPPFDKIELIFERIMEFNEEEESETLKKMDNFIK